MALMPPTICTTIANAAGYLQPPLRNARATIAIIHGNATHGRMRSLNFDVNSSAYGVSMYATAPTTIPGPCWPSVR